MRVVIAEDSGLLRQMLVEALVRRGLEVVGQSGSGPGAVRLVDSLTPDAAVVDVRMPPTYRDEGLQAAREIRTRHRGVGILVLSQFAETAYAVELLQDCDGGVGYLVKDRVQSGDALVDAIRRVAAGETVIDPDIVHRLMSRPRTVDPLEGLADSEREVLGLMAEGLSNSAIARRLHYSLKTVEKRIGVIVRKLGLADGGDPTRSDINVRVLAVLAHLRSADGGDDLRFWGVGGASGGR
jgi:DNA-binding NarL/FixJ family response regulator